MKMPENAMVEPPKIVQPREHKAKVLVWADLTVADMDSLEETTSPEEIKELLVEIFHMDNNEENLKTGILLDLYFYTLQFARDNSFTKEQTSAFFSMVKKVHEVCAETPFGNVTQCFKYFKELVLCHAVKRPPFSIDLFSPDEVRKITEYVINTYFRHYKMYKYAFTPLVRLDLSMTYIGVPVSTPPSEAGDEPPAGDAETGEAEGEDKTEEEPKEEEPPREESPAAKEIRAMIQTHLSEELSKLKLTMDEQIKETDEIMNKKLLVLEGGAASGKGGKGSGKGKKK